MGLDIGYPKTIFNNNYLEDMFRAVCSCPSIITTSQYFEMLCL